MDTASREAAPGDTSSAEAASANCATGKGARSSNARQRESNRKPNPSKAQWQHGGASLPKYQSPVIGLSGSATQ